VIKLRIKKVMNLNFIKNQTVFPIILVALVLYLTGCKQQVKPQQETGKDSTRTKAPQNDTLNAKLKIEIINKEFQSSTASDPKDYNVVTYKLTNNTAKNMKEIDADVVISDLSGNVIKKIKINELDVIAAGDSRDYKALYSCNAFSNKDMALKNMELKNIKFESTVLSITYQDGTKETFK